MTTKSVKTFLALILCLCALLLCGSALADGYSVTTVFPHGTCTAVTAATSQTNYNTAGNLDGVTAGTRVTLEVATLTGYEVSKIECSYTLGGNARTDLLELDVGNTVMCAFTMPAADVQLTVFVHKAGDVYYPLTASTVLSNCRSILLETENGQSGLEVEAMEGETVTVTAVPENGYEVSQMNYTTMYSAVTAIPFTVDANGTATGSFVMPGEDVVVHAIFAKRNDTIMYLNENGGTQYASAAVLSDQATTLGGWYYVKDGIVINNRISIGGEANLILCDGATLTVHGGIQVAESDSLTIYAQSTGGNMGALTIDSVADHDAGIGAGRPPLFPCPGSWGCSPAVWYW